MAVRRVDLFVNGKSRPARGGATFKSVNPATGATVAVVARGGRADVDRAVGAAERAFPGWAATPGEERGRILARAADVIEARAKELARLETLDVGKPIADTTTVDIPATVRFLRWYAGVTLETAGETIPFDNPGQIDFTLRQPYGVVGLISPWNFPLLTAMLKIGPALATGNTAVMKPATWTPVTTLLLGEIFAEAGLPRGVLNVVAGPGDEVGEAICSHPSVRKVFFTGSTEVGRRILRVAAENVTDTSVELGGKSANIIFADADWDQALAGAVFGIMFNNGQNCISGSRLLVEKKTYKKFVAALAERFRALRVGDPLKKTTMLGPVVARGHYETVMEYIRIGREEGAKIECGGKHPAGRELAKGCYIEPTLFSGVSNTMRVAREEIFGPVLVAIPFDGEDEAVAIANDTPYGLGNGVFTTDLGKAHRVARRLESGTVYVNTYNMVSPQSPFPAWKQSGIGVERGHHGLVEFTRCKNVIMDISGQALGWG